MAHTNETPESRTLLVRRIAQLEDDLAETRGCIVRLASVIETLLIDGPQPVIDEPDIPDTGTGSRQSYRWSGAGRGGRTLRPGRSARAVRYRRDGGAATRQSLGKPLPAAHANSVGVNARRAVAWR